MRSTKTKEQIFKESFALFTNGKIPNSIFNAYMNDENGDGVSELQSWILSNMRADISDWCTAIGIIESVELLYNISFENGNLSM